MPKPGAAKKAAKGSSRRRAPAKKKPKKRSSSRAAILPSQSIDHGTPEPVAEGIIYPVLGDPVDLDPCSNPDSIIRARRKVMLPEDGLAIPWRDKTFVNPPYGDKLIKPFMEKIVSSYRHDGAEIIALIPANVSAEWFDIVATTARAAFLWGPGEGGRRVKFRGNEHSATFASVVAYWGPDLPKFVRYAIRCCHPWYPEYAMRLTRAILGIRGDEPSPTTDAFVLADELLSLGRHDNLAAALLSLGDTTLGQIIDNGDSALLHHLRGLSTYELASALVTSTRPGVHYLDRRLPKTSAIPDPRQLGLLAAQAGPQGPNESVDDAALRHISAADKKGLGVAQLMEGLNLSRGEARGALQRLRKQEKVIKTGTTNRAAYVAVREEG
jgi:hypothetical protein